jgi:hypothetical protein
VNAMCKVFPSVSKQDEVAYQKLQTSLRKSRGHIEGAKEKGETPVANGSGSVKKSNLGRK